MKNNYYNVNLLKRTILALGLLIIAMLAAILSQFGERKVLNLASQKLPIYCVDTKEKKISLTFDVSWGTDYTEDILQVLDKYNVKATFFVVGKWMDDNEDKVKAIYSRGHELGNHSDKHPDMTLIAKESMIQDIYNADAKIIKLTGEKPKLYRCPSGSYNTEVIDTIEKSGHYCIQWDVDSLDWKNQGADIEYQRVVSRVKPGSILLFHNYGQYTADNLQRIIERLKGEGYTFVKVGELIYKDNYHMDFMGKQILN